MISIVIPTLNAERTLAATLTALVPASIEGLVREVIIVDGGSGDATLQIAEEAGAKIISTTRGRGHQLAEGGRAANGPWLLFLHADTILEPGWSKHVGKFVSRYDERGTMAGTFTFALDDEGIKPRLVELMVGLRSTLLKLPYGDQGLLIRKTHYDQLGGYGELPLMEDVDLIRRIGRTHLHILPGRAVTSAVRYQTEGYARRIGRNLYCLGLYFAGVSPAKIAKRYERGSNEGS